MHALKYLNDDNENNKIVIIYNSQVVPRLGVLGEYETSL